MVGVVGGPGEDEGLIGGGIVHQSVLASCHHGESALAIAVHRVEAMLIGDSWTIAPEMARHRVVVDDTLYDELICPALFPMGVDVIYHVGDRAVASVCLRSATQTEDGVSVRVYNLLFALWKATVKMLTIMAPDWLTGRYLDGLIVSEKALIHEVRMTRVDARIRAKGFAWQDMHHSVSCPIGIAGEMHRWSVIRRLIMTDGDGWKL